MTKLEIIVLQKISYPKEVIQNIKEIGFRTVEVEVKTPWDHSLITYHVNADNFLIPLTIREVDFHG